MAAISISYPSNWESMPPGPVSKEPRPDARSRKHTRLPRHTYWVRRTVAAGFAVVAVFTGAWAAGLVTSLDQVTAAPPVLHAPIVHSVAAEVYVVQPGDTLWSIARAVAPESDVRKVVDQLADLNGGAELQVGQRVLLPDPP